MVRGRVRSSLVSDRGEQWWPATLSPRRLLSTTARGKSAVGPCLLVFFVCVRARVSPCTNQTPGGFPWSVVCGCMVICDTVLVADRQSMAVLPMSRLTLPYQVP